MAVSPCSTDYFVISFTPLCRMHPSALQLAGLMHPLTQLIQLTTVLILPLRCCEGYKTEALMATIPGKHQQL